MSRMCSIVFGLAAAALLVSAASAQDFAVDWWTVDGGGEMFTTGGDFELSGTVGQPDANTTVMTGGDFELAGGFWPGAAAMEPQFELGDLNCDGSVNGLDIDPFVLVLTSTPPEYPEYYAQHPDCDPLLADCNTDGSINGLDIDPFVAILTGD